MVVSGPVAGIDADQPFPAYRRHHEQFLRILGEDLNGFFLGALGQAAAHLAFQGGLDQALVGVADRRLQQSAEDRVAAQDGALDYPEQSFLVGLHAHFQFPFFLTAVDGQDAVVGNAGKRFFFPVIHIVNGLLLRIGSFAGQPAAREGLLAQVGGEVGIIRDVFGDDVTGSLQGFGNVGNFLFRVDEGRGEFFRGAAPGFLSPQDGRQRFQAFARAFPARVVRF